MRNIVELLADGGPIVAILTVFSVLGLAVVLLKLWHFWQLRSVYNPNFDAAVEQVAGGDFNRARLLLGQEQNPRRSVIVSGVELLEAQCWSTQDLKEELNRQARKATAEVSSFLRVLEVIAVTAPLLGLFGTVLGMIEAFKAMELAGSQVDPSVLSGGIWKALATTAVGLGVAIPASLFNSWFERRIENFAGVLGDDISRLITATHDHSLHNQRVSKQA